MNIFEAFGVAVAVAYAVVSIARYYLRRQDDRFRSQ